LLADAFEGRFGHPPLATVRAPGRVNLIGEHTDYSLLPVLPLAIDRALLVAVGPGLNRAESLRHPGDRWHDYLSAVRAVLPRGPEVDLLVGGDLPSTGGLSSSSALTVGLIAAFDEAWDLGLGKSEIVDLAVASERRMGLEGGAMDQTVIVAAEAGHALRIDFDPPSHRNVPVPPDVAIVAAYSGTTAAKGGPARALYNEKAALCREAAFRLGRLMGVDVGKPPTLSRVARLPGVVEGLAQLPGEVREAATHVLSEAGRVDEAERALREGRLGVLGELLDASHASLQRFGASTPALDVLVAGMRSAGAYGARLTGAGFGGFAVAVCGPQEVDAVVATALQATGGPAFRVQAAAGLSVWRGQAAG